MTAKPYAQDALAAARAVVSGVIILNPEGPTRLATERSHPMEPTALYLARLLDGYSADAREDDATEVADDLAGAAAELRRLHAAAEGTTP